MTIVFLIIFLSVLLYAINCYQKKDYKKGCLVYFFFVTEGFHLFPKDILGGFPINKITDFALIYLIFVITTKYINGKLRSYNEIYKVYGILFLYISFIFVLSIINHSEYFSYALQTYRNYFHFLSFFLIVDLEKNDMIWLFKKIFFVTLLTTLLYIQQPLTDIQFTYSAGIGESEDGGLQRYRNLPFIAYCFLIYSTIFIDYTKLRTVLLCLTFIIMLVLSQHRGIMIGYVISISVFLIFSRQFKKVFQLFVIGIIIFVSFGTIISERFEQSNTSDDITNIFDTNINDVSNFQTGDGTLSFRIFLLMERFMYLYDNPKHLLCGIGMRHEDSPKTNEFNFVLGSFKTVDEQMVKQQISSGDLVWMTPLFRFGLLGFCFYLMITILSLLYFKNHFDDTMFAKGAFCYYLLLVIVSFKNDMLFDRIHLFMVFLLISMVKNNIDTRLLNN